MSEQFEIEFHPHPWQRKTSLEAWEAVKSCGWATKKAKQAYQILFHHGPLTLLELEHHSALLDGRTPRGRSESTIIRRLYDLRDNGLVETTSETRVCQVSKKNAVTWDVTGSMPPEHKRLPDNVCSLCGHVIRKKKVQI